MTRTQTRTYGVVAPSSRQPLLAAMLRAFVWLVSSVASMLGAIVTRPTRDWHTDEAQADQLSMPSDKQQEPQHPQPSFSGKAAGRIPGIPVVSTQGTTPHSLRTPNQDARHKAEHDTMFVAAPSGNGPLAVFPAQARIQSARNARYSRDLSPLVPTNVGTQGECRALSQLAASSLHPQHNRSWIPTSVGMSGMCRGLLQA